MIFVTTGTNEVGFDRLVRAVDLLPPGEEVVVQVGHSSARSSRGTCVEFLPFDEVVELVRRARVVVSHAGVGSIMVALSNGQRPVVVPRRPAAGEAVDDHQRGLARRLAAAGMVVLLEDERELPRATAADGRIAAVLGGDDRRLAGDLRDYLRARVPVRAAEAGRVA